MGENIGAAARAMLNFGFRDLRLVAPRDGWPNKIAEQNSSGALGQMAGERRIEGVRLFDDLAAAVSDCHYVFGTSARRRDMVKPVFTPDDAKQETITRLSQNQKTAFVFGPERTGLENDDLALCHGFISVPVNPDFASINLGQAVLLISYALSGLNEDAVIPYTQDNLLASHYDLENFISRLLLTLEEKQFFKSDDLKPTMQRNIRNMFMRGDLTAQEINTLHGIISALIGEKLK